MKTIFLILLLLLPGVGLAQSVQQSGSVTPGHAAQWVTSGVVKDAGPATAGNLTELGITRNGGLPFCISTALGALTGAPYQQMCLSVTSAGAGRIDLNAYNGASQLPFIIAIGGVPVFTSGTSPADVPFVTRVTSGTTNSAPALVDQTVAWASAATSNKAQTVPTCTSTIAGYKVTVKDEQANAATYPIVITPAANTIDNVATASINQNGRSLTLQCDGVSNWMLI